MTYPLLVALERDPKLHSAVLECAQKPPEQPLPAPALASVLSALHKTGAIEACRDFAATHSRDAIAIISDLECGETVAALTTIAEATTFRRN